MNYAGHKIAVLGAGESGRSAAFLLHRSGATVTVLDTGASNEMESARQSLEAAGIHAVFGAEALDQMSGYDQAVVSPGIDPTAALVRALEAHGIPWIGELELAWKFCVCPVVAITGTNGKTTTTQLVERMLLGAGVRTLAAGNIGPAFSAKVSESAGLDMMILEVSSFQLERIEAFRPRVAVWLGLAPDHLDRYASMADYRAAKLRIFENQTSEDWAVVNLRSDLPDLAAQKITFSAYESGADFELKDGVILFRGRAVLKMSETRLRGLHNAENLMAALGVGVAMGMDLGEIVGPLKEYESLPHRCEWVRTLDAIDWINDSKGTNPDSVEKALQSETRPVVLIAGGKDKGFEYDTLTDLVASKCRAAVLLGEMAGRIEALWRDRVPCFNVGYSLPEAVAQARCCAHPGDVVLFSPGTSSFDMFRNYADRGNQFRGLVEALSSDAAAESKTPVYEK
jgi:UDP-N-acetylmuramoylalanine--D-glutamate ligase